MRIRKHKKPKWQIKIAKERISILFEAAKRAFRKQPERSKRYIELLRKIGLRYNLRLPKQIKRNFCKNCNQLLIPSVTSTIKIDKYTKVVIIKCLNCGKIYRYPYKR